MAAIDEARKCFFQQALPVLEKEFGEFLPRIASGIAGRGSECFGFDDDISRDHDFVPGFAMWLTPEDERLFGFKLERTYAAISKNFPAAPTSESRLGNAERGVIIIDEFFRRHLGFPGAPGCWQEWLYTPEYAFAEVLNGEVFRDDAGVFSAVRHTIRNEMPHDVRCKKLAARAIMMAQSGQYNFSRCLKHGEPGAAALALAEFVHNTVSMVFLLNDDFAPYYKWQFKAMRKLPKLAMLAETLEFLLTTQLSGEETSEIIDEISSAVATELNSRGLSEQTGVYLEPYAFDIQSHIRNRELRQLHIMEG